MPRRSQSTTMRHAIWAIAALSLPAGAQQAPPPPAEQTPAAEPPPEPTPEEPAPAERAASPAPKAPAAAPSTAPREASQRYKDIMVVPYRSFLKSGRIELAPSAGININDDLIPDFALGGEANYFLSEAFSVGALFEYFPTPSGITDLETDVRRRYVKFPTHNEYDFAGMGNVAYVPIYGKFTILGWHVVHWESYVGAGAGIMRTQTVPLSASVEPQVNNDLAFNVAFGGRFFISRWFSGLFSIRDFLFNDKFDIGPSTAPGGGRAIDTRFVQNVILSIGVGIYFPTSFKYTTLR
jgi:outer membrane beta-barrel protein